MPTSSLDVVIHAIFFEIASHSNEFKSTYPQQNSAFNKLFFFTNPDIWEITTILDARKPFLNILRPVIRDLGWRRQSVDNAVDIMKINCSLRVDFIFLARYWRIDSFNVRLLTALFSNRALTDEDKRFHQNADIRVHLSNSIDLWLKFLYYPASRNRPGLPGHSTNRIGNFKQLQGIAVASSCN